MITLLQNFFTFSISLRSIIISCIFASAKIANFHGIFFHSLNHRRSSNNLAASSFNHQSKSAAQKNPFWNFYFDQEQRKKKQRCEGEGLKLNEERKKREWKNLQGGKPSPLKWRICETSRVLISQIQRLTTRCMCCNRESWEEASGSERESLKLRVITFECFACIAYTHAIFKGSFPPFVSHSTLEALLEQLDICVWDF